MNRVDKELRAYHVHDKEESGEEALHEIVFAESPSQAKYISEANGVGVPWTSISVKRSPKFDQYATDGNIPKSAYVADGWYFECDKCFSFSATNAVGNDVYCDDCIEEFKEVFHEGR
jgi:hypothetical protein